MSTAGERPWAPAPRELIESERRKWGAGTARAPERGLLEDDAKAPAGGRSKAGKGKKRAGSRRPRGKEDRGRGPAILRWRMFNVELTIDLDPGKDDCSVSQEVRAWAWGVVTRSGCSCVL